MTLDVFQGEGVRDIPLKRVGRPAEVAKVVVFLASECSAWRLMEELREEYDGR